MKQPVVDFVIVMDELKKEGKIQISPLSREANSFDCPKCGSLLSPDNPDSYSEFRHEGHKGYFNTVQTLQNENESARANLPCAINVSC